MPVCSFPVVRFTCNVEPFPPSSLVDKDCFLKYHWNFLSVRHMVALYSYSYRCEFVLSDS